MAIVFFIFIRSPLVSISSFHFLNFTINSSILYVISMRSSTYNNSSGHPDLNSCDNASSTIMNNKGLSTDPWWTPTFTTTFTTNSSLSVLLTHTQLLAFVYIACTTVTGHSSTPNLHIVHHTTSHGTLSKAFSKSTNAKYNFFFLPKYFFCKCLTKHIGSVPHTQSHTNTHIHTQPLTHHTTYTHIPHHTTHTRKHTDTYTHTLWLFTIFCDYTLPVNVHGPDLKVLYNAREIVCPQALELICEKTWKYEREKSEIAGVNRLNQKIVGGSRRTTQTVGDLIGPWDGYS